MIVRGMGKRQGFKFIPLTLIPLTTPPPDGQENFFWAVASGMGSDYVTETGLRGGFWL